MPTRSRHSVKDHSTRVAPGIAIYRTRASPFWMARVRDSRAKKNVVRSTKETSKLEARKVAEELALQIRTRERETPRQYTFMRYATMLIEKGMKQAERGERNSNYIRTIRFFLDNEEYGLRKHFAAHDVRELKTREWQLFIESVRERRSDLTPSTCNTLMATFRNVLKVARDDGAIAFLPTTPRGRQKDNPRSFFRFAPLVPRESDEYQALLRGARDLARDGTVVRGIPLTEELRDLILFCVHSFVRPTTTELFALKHSDITVQDQAEGLIVTVRNGKTGSRRSVTMDGAVAPYKRLRERYPNAGGEDYIFLPNYPIRATAARIFQRHFNLLLDRTELKHDNTTGTDRSLYCLRHNAICMRIVLSEGKVDIYTLAKNAGTSVDQIERFYTKHLPISPEMAKNLQSYGT
jgi:hypothetical protein